MKITAVSVIRLQGVLDYEGEFWEERLVRPLDIYPEHKAQGPHEMFAVGEGRYNITAYFVEVETDEGVAGRGGPLPIDQAFVIQTQLAPLLYRSRPAGHRTTVGPDVPSPGTWTQRHGDDGA